MSDETTNPVLGGVLFGLAFYGVAHWLTGPALGVKMPEWVQGGKTIGMHTMNHIGFGLMTALAARIQSAVDQRFRNDRPVLIPRRPLVRSLRSLQVNRQD